MADEEGAAEAERSRYRHAFEAVMRRILKDYQGQDAEVRNGMESGMRRLFEKPYSAELGVALGSEPLPLEDARRTIFFPRLSDMKAYALAFGRPTPQSTARKEQLMKFKLLSVFYTIHREDGALVDRFMHCGGLQSLAFLLGEDNPYIQSQAMELLTDFLAPQMSSTAAASPRQAHLQHNIFLCLKSGELYKNVADILSQPGEVFPRSFASSIRLLAGAVGWLRPMDDAVPEGTVPPEAAACVAALQRCVSESQGALAPDVRSTAEALMEDLARNPTVRSDPLSGEALAKAELSIFDDESQLMEDAAHAWQALKLLGNEAFKSGLLWPAEAAYRLALEDGKAAIPETEASVVASNRALVLLKAGAAAEAAASAAEALVRNPRNSKAAFRRAQALMELPGCAQEALKAAEVAAELEPKDTQVTELLLRARAQCPISTQEVTAIDTMD
mmetsp:Transcript_33294/g.74852  ORF Transcript_33294/g.74852 Transcript_33294/m.74852 type:complete len:446 (-) Transcript_33294:29-1366(-)